MSLLSTFVGPLLGVFAAGMVASLPVVSASVAAAEQAAGGPKAVVQFLRGFVLGLFGRAVFGTVFTLAVVPLGAGLALALGWAGAASITLCCARSRAVRCATACPGLEGRTPASAWLFRKWSSCHLPVRPAMWKSPFILCERSVINAAYGIPEDTAYIDSRAFAPAGPLAVVPFYSLSRPGMTTIWREPWKKSLKPMPAPPAPTPRYRICPKALPAKRY